MVMSRRSFHLTTLFSWTSFNNYAFNKFFVYILSLVTEQPFLNESVEGKRISTKVWDPVGIKLESLDLQSDTHL